MVYFYGGGYVAGDGSEGRYNGESMARKGIFIKDKHMELIYQNLFRIQSMHDYIRFNFAVRLKNIYLYFLVASWIGPMISITASDRLVQDLDGTWQYQKVSNLVYPPTGNWTNIAVPGYLQGTDYERAWFRRSFIAPIFPSSSRVKLQFGGVKFNARIYVNGKFSGKYLNGYNPFTLDITEAVKSGQTNELLVGLGDWTETFSQRVDFSNMEPYENRRDHAVNTLLAPIGGRYDLYGIWQPVQLVIVPPVSITDIFVQTSVRLKEIKVLTTIQNDSDTDQSIAIQNQVVSQDADGLTLPNKSIVMPPRSTQVFEVSSPWHQPKLWSLSAPHLFFLETRLAGNNISDQTTTRFGFRELWREGSDLIFNGTKIHLLAASTWPPNNRLTRDQIRKTLQDTKAGNNVAIRFHTQPWDSTWYDVADEVGLLVVEEGAVWCDSRSYRLGDPVFWANFADHWKAAIKRDQNHPSIILWSLENELLHCGAAGVNSNAVQELARLGAQVKKWDSTRLITYEADLDPGGVADVIGLHYPHEYPDYQVWPNAAYWMGESIRKDWVPGQRWKWERDKPLYIGEYLWVPSTSAQSFTILFGDDAYRDPEFYRNKAKALTWRMQTEAYRSYGVNGLCPWTLFEDPSVISSTFDLSPDRNQLYQAQKAAYAPHAVFLPDYFNRYYAGVTANRKIAIYNESSRNGLFTLQWRSSAHASWNTRIVNLESAGRYDNTIDFHVPNTHGTFDLELELLLEGNCLFSNKVAFSSWEKPSSLSLPARRISLYDPTRNTGSILAGQGVTFTEVTNLSTADYGQWDVLMIGRHALPQESIPSIGENMLALQWERFMEKGGRVLVWEQTNYPSWMPLGISLENYPASFAFPDPEHAITRGMSPEILKWWAPDHLLAHHAIRIPSSINMRFPVLIGSQKGMEYAGILEAPFGRGGMICVQLLALEKWEIEPAASDTINRVLHYAAAPATSGSVPIAGILCDTNSAAGKKLASMRLLGENITDRFAQTPLSSFETVILAGGETIWQTAASQLPRLSEYVSKGGKLLIHRPSESFLQAAKPLLFPQLSWDNSSPGRILSRINPASMFQILNHDLYWLEQAGSWDRPELLSTNIASRIYRKSFNLANYTTLQAESMPVHSTGQASSGSWALYSNGYIAQNIAISTAGPYQFGVMARGTALGGIGPRLVLRIDGKAQDSITVNANTMKLYTLAADMSEGVHELSLAFDNDQYQPPEDRNVWIDYVRYGLDTMSNSILYLNSPCVTAQIPYGAGAIVLDEIAWETETVNQSKAERAAATLFTGMGIQIRPSHGLRLEAEQMKNVNIAAYSANNGLVYASSNGRIETSVHFTTAGVYTFELTASGTPAIKVDPIAQLWINGINKASIQVKSRSMDRYRANVFVTAGTHKIALAFINDYYAPPEDRNLVFDSLQIIPPSRIGLARISVESGVVRIQWEAETGVAYEIEASHDLNDWQPIGKATASGSICSWSENILLTFNSRYYRIRK